MDRFYSPVKPTFALLLQEDRVVPQQIVRYSKRLVQDLPCGRPPSRFAPGKTEKFLTGLGFARPRGWIPFPTSKDAQFSTGTGFALAAPLVSAHTGPARIASNCLVRVTNKARVAQFTSSRQLVYYRRKGWLLWRRNLYRGRRKRLVRYRFVASKGRMNPEERSKELPHIKADEQEWVFRFKRLPLSSKSLTQIAYLLQGKHIQDAIDWLCAIPRCRLNLIYVELIKARDQIAMEYGGDTTRLYITMVQGQYHRPYRAIRPVKMARFNRLRYYRNWLIIRIKQVSLENLFDRLYIRQKVPRSLASDMRIALREQRAPCYMLEEWQPYLSALSRRKHRQQLNWKDRTRMFDYKATRDAWIANYQRCLLFRENDLRAQRGLQHLVVTSQGSAQETSSNTRPTDSESEANT